MVLLVSQTTASLPFAQFRILSGKLNLTNWAKGSFNHCNTDFVRKIQVISELTPHLIHCLLVQKRIKRAKISGYCLYAWGLLKQVHVDRINKPRVSNEFPFRSTIIQHILSACS